MASRCETRVRSWLRASADTIRRRPRDACSAPGKEEVAIGPGSGVHRSGAPSGPIMTVLREVILPALNSRGRETSGKPLCPQEFARGKLAQRAIPTEAASPKRCRGIEMTDEQVGERRLNGSGYLVVEPEVATALGAGEAVVAL